MSRYTQKARPSSHQVERQELPVAELSQREMATQAFIERLRQVNLGTVILALGDEQDAERAAGVWRLSGGQVISITGETFYNHTSQRSGQGAIALVQDVRGGDVNEAISYLDHELGREVAIIAAARHALAIIRASRHGMRELRDRSPERCSGPDAPAHLDCR